jgi:uncharacterized RDD family membrane protein YckC
VFCTKCGAQYSAGTAFCQSCGNAVVAASAPPVPAPSVPAPFPAMAAPPMSVSPYGSASPVVYGPVVSYGGFWQRFAAYLIDGFITGAAIMVLVVPVVMLTGVMAHLGSLAHQPGEEMDPAAAAMFFTVMFGLAGIAILISWLYHAYLESGEKQATWGKSAMGLYVTDVAGQRISFARASGRFFSKIVTGMIPLFIGWIMAAFTERRQALHDMIASTVVLKR